MVHNYPSKDPINNEQWQQFLAFDFGTTKMGLASGQKITATATPLPPIKAQHGKPDWEQLTLLISKWKPDALIVGRPLNMDGSEQEVTLLAEKFAARLHGRYGLPVFLQDERLTTVDARSEIFAREGYQGIQKRSIDSLAACLILESWLNNFN